MLYKQILSGIAIMMTLAAFYPYIKSIIGGETKPHVFSWFIWGATTFIVFLAQLQEGAGVGAWPTAVSACITLYIAVLAYWNRADISITRLDWIFLFTAMSSLPLWYFAADPLWAVVVLTTVDVLGFGPTVRKAYFDPYSESLTFFGIFVVRNFITILALENYSVTTILFPAVIAISIVLFMTMVSLRRRVLAV
jgi:hypothetical protein